MAKKLKLGIIGLGMGKAHLTAITQHLDDIEAVAVADIDKKRLKTVGDTFCIPRRFTDYRKMLELAEIEGVLVVTPNALHAPMAIDAMNAGKHVLVEKPPSVDVNGAKRMLATSKKTRKKLMYGLSCRFRADVQTAKDLADRGALGEMYYGRTTWVRRYGIPNSSSFCVRATSGGGPLIDLGVHGLDMTWYIMGSPKPVSVVYNGGL